VYLQLYVTVDSDTKKRVIFSFFFSGVTNHAKKSE